MSIRPQPVLLQLRKYASASIRLPAAPRPVHTPRSPLTPAKDCSARPRLCAHLRAHPCPPSPLHRLESSFSATLVACSLLASVAISIAYNHYCDYTSAQEPSEEPALEDESPADFSDSPAGKSTEITCIPFGASYYEHMAKHEIKQGWPGNLTPEQDEKLREMWWQLSRLVGVTEGRPSVDAQSVHSKEGEKKKSRMGFLRGSGHSQSGSDATSNDKYNQKEDYLNAIAEQTPEQMRRTIWSFMKADEPDGLLCRFLRARKWDVQKALIMLVSTVRWRGSITHLDDQIIKRGEEWYANLDAEGHGDEKTLGNGFMFQYRHGKSWLNGVDKLGRPICTVHVRLHQAKDQTNEALEQFIIFSIETARMMLRPPVDTAMVIFDLGGFGMKNMDWVPLRFMVKIFEANYPESLGQICVHRAPWIFNSLWNIIKGLLDPVVASKIVFTKDANDLAQYIDREQIPKSLGGDSDWEQKYIEPTPGENKIMNDTAAHDRLQAERWTYVEEYEKATLAWATSEGKDKKAQSRRMEIYEKLRVNYWQLDPYVRARTYFDRIGVLQPGGLYEPYPKESPEYYMKHMSDVPQFNQPANGNAGAAKPLPQAPPQQQQQQQQQQARQVNGEGISRRPVASVPAVNAVAATAPATTTKAAHRLSTISTASDDDVFYDAQEF